MDNIQDYAARFTVDDHLLRDMNAKDYIEYQLDRLKRDAIYQAVEQAKGKWVCIKPILSSERNFRGGMDFGVRVLCRAVSNVPVKIYVPVYEEESMPKDAHKCTWCGGYTKDDTRGHCSGCGGPRNEEYLDQNG